MTTLKLIFLICASLIMLVFLSNCSGLILDSIDLVTYEDPEGDDDGDYIINSRDGIEDLDDDGVPNFLDYDSDGDGIADRKEGDFDSDRDDEPDFLDNYNDELDQRETDVGSYFHLPEDVGLFLLSMEQNFSTIAQLRIIGYSSGNPAHPIYALKITDNPDVQEDEPEIQLVGALHGDEQLSCEIMLKLIEYILYSYGQEALTMEIVDNNEIHIIPLANPWGLLKSSRENGNGVDLNRNFGWAWVPGKFSGNSSFDQPETQALKNDADMNSYNLSVNFHSGASGIAYLWDYTGTTESLGFPGYYSLQYFLDNLLPVYPAVEKAAFEYSQSVNQNGDGNFFSIEGFDWYPAYGTMQDWMYGEKNAVAFTVELDGRKNYTDSDAHLINEVWDRHRDSILNLIGLGKRGFQGTVSDEESGEPVNALITINRAAPSSSKSLLSPDPVRVEHQGYTDPDVGDYHTIIHPGIYDVIIQAEGYREEVFYSVFVPESGSVRLDAALIEELPGLTGKIVDGLKVSEQKIRQPPDVSDVEYDDIRSE